MHQPTRPRHSDPQKAASPSRLALVRPDGGRITPSRLLGLVLKELQGSELTDQTVQRMAETMTRFVTYLEKGHRLASVRDVAEEHVEGFVFASILGRVGPRRPEAATMHERRSALRLYFRVARQLGAFSGDPTLDMVLPARSGLPARPLTDDEIALCRSFSVSGLTETRRPAAWALAEATARTAEIPHIRVADVDFDAGRVWIHGGSRCEPRWGLLTPWGLKQVGRRVEALRRRGGRECLAYDGSDVGKSGQASSCVAISQTILAAGLDREPDIRPASVAAWAGQKVFAETGDIAVVATRLGCHSLDRAARLIGWEWKGDGGAEGGGR